jgi:transposase
MKVERYIGQLRRETGTRFTFRQATPAPLYAEDQDESRPAPLTALRAARLFLSIPEDQRPTDRTLLAHLLRLDPVMTPTYHQVQGFCRMIRERRGPELNAWITEVQQTGVKELRGFVQGLLKDEAAVRAGLSLVWSHGPTEGFIHRLKLLKRQAYGRAGVDFLRHRILAPSAGVAASSSGRSAMVAGEVLGAGARRRMVAAGKGRAGVL